MIKKKMMIKRKMIKMKELRDAAKNCLLTNMALNEDEKITIITDPVKKEIGEVFYEEACRISKECKILLIETMSRNGEEPPEDIAKEMLDCDVLLFVTDKSLSHTRARKAATGKGIRIASMPGITKEIMARSFNADYNLVRERSVRLCDALDKGEKVRVITEKGTDISFSIKGRKSFGRDGGIYDEKGKWGNMPAGEACLAPVEGTASGTYVIDTASPLGTGMLTIPIRITVKEGYAVKIEGDKMADELREALEKVGKDAFNIAELGIGTNDSAKITGVILEDEKVFGTAHIALGNNKSFGGNIDVPLHLDGVFREPTILIDDKKVMDKGKLLI